MDSHFLVKRSTTNKHTNYFGCRAHTARRRVAIVFLESRCVVRSVDSKGEPSIGGRNSLERIFRSSLCGFSGGFVRYGGDCGGGDRTRLRLWRKVAIQQCIKEKPWHLWHSHTHTHSHVSPNRVSESIRLLSFGFNGNYNL